VQPFHCSAISVQVLRKSAALVCPCPHLIS
jgi:hypothetical protein